MGFVYNLIFTSCLASNVLFICYYNIFPDSKLGVKVIKFNFKRLKYLNWKRKWFNDKKLKAEKFP